MTSLLAPPGGKLRVPDPVGGFDAAAPIWSFDAAARIWGFRVAALTWGSRLRCSLAWRGGVCVPVPVAASRPLTSFLSTSSLYCTTPREELDSFVQ
ncbi:hypothetical protein [Paenibacillus sp. JSM ZJ436]|uniref:hypothetical protein n=1 Tax=Paenibacillus sp. JSM ZJ436 TaxID=3376190 RepID=UPI0037C858D7